MPRNGSPWQGLGAVLLKEISDNLSSARMRVLEGLMALTAIAAIYAAAQQVRDTTSQDAFLFLSLFTKSREPLPSLVVFLSFLAPLVAIGLGFDAISGEHNRRTLSRILSQPIYRDALLAGKFLAGLVTLTVSFVALWLILVGLGLVVLGLPPSWEEMARALVFLVITVFYAGLWLGVAVMFSVLFRSPATAALASLGTWLFLSLIWPVLAPALSQMLFAAGDPATVATIGQNLARLSPSTLFGEVVLAVLNPGTRTLGPIYLSQLQGAVLGAPLPLGQSLIIAWPQIVGLIGGTIALFAASYVVFQRQEIRA
jgi:ABC-2 type transport system permease protein